MGFPNFRCERMVGTTDIDSKNAVFRLKGYRNVKVVFAGGIGLNIFQFFFQVFNTWQS